MSSLAWLALVIAVGPCLCQGLPRFEDYPAEAWTGPARPVVLATPSERMFRTRLTEASKGKPQFAGSLREAAWGCGSNCWAGAFVDLATGLVHTLPPRDSRAGWEHWILCTGATEGCGFEYRLNSRLLIFRCGFNFDQNNRNHPDVSYFVWEGERFRLLKHIKAPRQAVR